MPNQIPPEVQNLMFTAASRTELLCYGHIVLTRTTMGRNFEAKIFKLCRTMIIIEHTGVPKGAKNVQSRPKPLRVGRSARPMFLFFLA